MTDLKLYEHTQSTNAFVVGFVAYIALISLIVAAVGESPWLVVIPGAVVAIPVGLVLLGASALTVTVTAEDVHLRWRLRWPTKSIPRSEIVSVERVRNKWWYGWGIRLTPNGWMWNLWGLDGVKLNRTSGKGFVIGTDDPDALLAVLDR